MKPLRVRSEALPAQVAAQASIAAAADRAQDAAAPAQDAMARHAATAAAETAAAAVVVRAASVSPTKTIAKLRANRASRAGNRQQTFTSDSRNITQRRAFSSPKRNRDSHAPIA